MLTRLETTRLILRPFEEADRSPNARIFADPEVRRFALGLLDGPAANARIDEAIRQLGHQGYGILAVECRADHAFIGMIGFTGFDAALRQTIPSHPDLQLVWPVSYTHLR